MTHFNNLKLNIIIVSTVVALLGWLAYTNFMPKPLGDKMEYLGKTDYGCYFLCSSEPGSRYYYGTDMTPEEVVGYFKGAGLKYPIEEKSDYIDIWLQNEKETDSIHIYYYEQSQDRLIERSLKPMGNKYLIEMVESDYQKAKDSL